MRRLLKDAKLYLVLDRQVNDYDQLFEILKQASHAGVDVIQLRDKRGLSRDILEFSRRALKYLNGKIPFIVNDRVDLAYAAWADGVHVGQEDVPIEFARKILGKRKIIGVSCQTLAQAKAAQRDGADYIGFGSVFKTLTKPDRDPMDLSLLLQVIEKVEIPVFPIGGIDLVGVQKLHALGIKRAAVTRAISVAANVKKATQAFLEILD